METFAPTARPHVAFWDEAVVPMPQVERQLLPDADVQRLSVRKAPRIASRVSNVKEALQLKTMSRVRSNSRFALKR
ncbi:hypothetical protein LK12_22045 [Novosphingobium malaysiense]|uniref:Uncharacterized protein n=1 Tax=Novosphingobium malaysiense TaxID=1348853 RepID=A0A0B1ZIU7_9SPHN|nr:hypothetical protein LK12_22045 [Novosphingobium malaysiense]